MNLKNSVFDENVNKYEEWFERNNFILESEVNAIMQLLPSFDIGIEIGTGTGVFASKLGIEDGLEPSLEMCRKAIERGINIINACAEQIPVNTGVYQIALMVTVDCFLNNVLHAFKEIHRILRVDGYFVVAFIYRDTILGQLYEQKKSTNPFYENANFHSGIEMIKLLVDAGFEVVDERQTIFSFDNVLQDVKKGIGEGVFAVIKAKKAAMI